MSAAVPRDAHLRQAQHNQQFAEHVADSGSAYDWAITACFYSSLHFFDHWLLGQRVKVTELARNDGVSPHVARSRLARQKLSFADEVTYRTLRIQSELARYMSSKDGDGPQKAACDFFDESAARDRLSDLQTLRQALGYSGNA